MAFPKTQPQRKVLDKLKEAKEFAQQIVENPEYRAQLLRRAITGHLPAAVELRLLDYTYGKPADQVTLNVPQLNPEEYGELSDEALAQRAERLARAIREGRKFEVVARGSDKVM